MTSTKIRVGVIGANAERGWASRSHLPALRALPEFDLAAVCTTRAESARQSAETFGAAEAYDDHVRMLEQADIDVVAVSVKVPDHYRPTMDALEAGKHVYTEWPLGANLREAEEMTDLARAMGVADDGRAPGAADADLPAAEGAGRRRVRGRGAVVQHELVPVRGARLGPLVVVAGGQGGRRQRLHRRPGPPRRRPLHGPGRVRGGVRRRRDHRRPLGRPGLRALDSQSRPPTTCSSPGHSRAARSCRCTWRACRPTPAGTGPRSTGATGRSCSTRRRRARSAR